MLDPVDAQLTAFGLHHQAGARDAYEGLVVDPGLHQILGEFGTQARGGGVVVHPVIDDAESVAIDGLVELGGDVVSRRKALSQPQRRDRLSPAARLIQCVGQHLKRLCLHVRVLRPKITVRRGQDRLLRVAVAVGALAGPALPQGKGGIAHPHIGLIGQRHGPRRPCPGLGKTSSADRRGDGRPQVP